MTILDQKLLDILICPISKSSLKYDKENNELISEESGLAYPVKDGIPVMLPEEARKI
ncbi:Trm112 family protein [Gammaproteobacteria bacterium]|nr:Trm112 family protein [Gammaproteobacteria bacterium]